MNEIEVEINERGSDPMPSHVATINELVKTLGSSLRNMPVEALEELRTIIKRPGWTTPQEAMLVQTALATMIGLSGTLNQLALRTLAISRQIGESTA